MGAMCPLLMPAASLHQAHPYHLAGDPHAPPSNHLRTPFPGKWARGGWSGIDEQEKQIKEETQATLRCFPFDQPAGPHTCFMTGQPAAEVAIFAKSY